MSITMLEGNQLTMEKKNNEKTNS